MATVESYMLWKNILTGYTILLSSVIINLTFEFILNKMETSRPRNVEFCTYNFNSNLFKNVYLSEKKRDRDRERAHSPIC